MPMIPRMKLSDRITWAVLLWIFVNLLWLKFLDSIIPQWVGAILITASAAAFVIFGPRPREDLEEDEEATIVQRGEGT